MGSALLTALGLRLAFPVVLLTGAMVRERTDPRLGLAHAGDWFLELLVVSLVVTVW